MSRTTLIRILPALALLIVLSTSAFAASSAAYWTVVEDDAPSTEVIAAANFAASMKVSVATTFTGKIRSDANAKAISQDLDDALIVMIDGKSVTIMQGTLPEFDIVVQTAQEYFRREGFRVTMAGPDVRTLRGDADDDAREDDEQETPQAQGEDSDSSSQQEQQTPLIQELEIPGSQEETPQPPPPEPPLLEREEPGFFGRLWDWFSGLFG